MNHKHPSHASFTSKEHNEAGTLHHGLEMREYNKASGALKRKRAKSSDPITITQADIPGFKKSSHHAQQRMAHVKSSAKE